MFYECYSLIYLNIKNFNTLSVTYNGSIFDNINSNLTYCIINETKISNIISQLSSYKKQCFNESQTKFIINKITFIDNCINDDKYKYEYNNICYESCPKGTSVILNNYLCEDLNCYISYNMNETECLDYIPEGFYISNHFLKTLDKCHDDCKTCDKKNTENNTNCNSCYNSKYLDLGNCVTNCTYGYFTDSFNNRICKCSYDIKCLYCTQQSIKDNLCISCNIEKNYYPKFNDSSNKFSFIDCYNNPEGYFLYNNQYYKCYPTCKYCTELGNEDNNKCSECINNYTFIYDFEKENNCYKICDYYYYFDINNKYQCTSEKKCPEIFNNLIKEKNKCIRNCTDDPIYKYKYNNQCYEFCPNGTHISSDSNYICEEDLFCDKYYNYNHTGCIDEIPDSYYLNNSILKTIDKCDIKCQKCSLESNKNNKCISCNINNNYYSIYNDILTTNISFINCYSNLSEGYFLDNNIYKPCFSTCKSCLELGNDYDNKCIECKLGYSFIDDFDNNKNCYKLCKYYYYFDSKNKYHCTSENKCIPEYNKLIKDKNKCINNCIEDKEYKYEYNNICYKSCPNGAHISSKNNNLCEKECPKDMPYENIENNECMKECNSIELFNGLCKIKNNNTEIKNNVILNIKEELTNGELDSLLMNLTEGERKDLIIKMIKLYIK